MIKKISGLIYLGLVFVSSCQQNPLGTESKSGANFYPGLDSGPVISSISPSLGQMAGGTNITLTGKRFTSKSTVKVGGTSCAQITFSNPTRIVCLTPQHTLGVKDIYIENQDKQKFTLPGVFTYITNITGRPGFGISSGGTITVGNMLSMSSVIGEPVQGETMLGVTTQLRIGVGGILFAPSGE